jgi:hypothetical protein
LSALSTSREKQSIVADNEKAAIEAAFFISSNQDVFENHASQTLMAAKRRNPRKLTAFFHSA